MNVSNISFCVSHPLLIMPVILVGHGFDADKKIK